MPNCCSDRREPLELLDRRPELGFDVTKVGEDALGSEPLWCLADDGTENFDFVRRKKNREFFGLSLVKE